MKLKMRTTATLLIAIFMISTLAVAVPVFAQPYTYYVATTGDDNNDGSEGSPWLTIQHAVDTVAHGDTILVGPGDYDGATINKDIEIRGEGAKIVDDPVPGSWQFGFLLVPGSDGATISHFTFEVEIAIYGKVIDDVTVEHNKIYDTVQGISNWDGNNWVIRHNVIGFVYATTGGGIGIAFGSRNSPVSGNIVSHNKIVADIPDDRDFSAGGILLCTDERYGWDPGVVTDNKIVHNKIKITGLKTWAIALQVIGLSEYPVVDPEDIIYAKDMLNGNIVGFNDLRGSDLPLGSLPRGLRNVNTISRNLGETYEIWSLVGDWKLEFDYLGGKYPHDMSITEETDTTFSGTGTNSHTWVVTGTKVGAEIEMVIDYDNSGYLVGVIGTIDTNDGSISGTWASNTGQSGTWESTDGAAILQDQGLGVNRGQGEVPANIFNPN